MSRAFMKERDDRPTEEVPVPLSSQPNYVTPRGLLALQRRLRAATEPREKTYLEARLETAILIDNACRSPKTVEFGATVGVHGDGFNREFTVVGEDEADVAHNLISHSSPLAQALIGAAVGDRVLWKRPAGDMQLTVRSIAYR